ncbi:coiled-coil domain-containing protein 15 isoform X3 [Moschus berezovskii]|uniref:coiled-coil domain-containing protein 15 isoform X3 n=1 Tax=Moschus berezovskii TaxID=68408 RepID=UPI00244397D1|nr:coiled-coil domain-containing protein 15 isoform X3 [Moschus berezovskii]
MPRSMAPLKKPRNTTKLPLALNPLKSKDVLAVLAERNQAIVPVGAWVEPAPPDSSEVPAATSAYIIEEELKEQLRKKQEALKRFQRQVKSRVNQQIRLRKKQQLQQFYEAAEKEGSIAMHSSDPAHLTPKRTSVFPSNLNAAIGRATLPPPQMLEGGIEDRENQNELFQQQAQAKALCRKPSFTRINIGVRGELSLEVHQDLLTPADYQKSMDDQEPEESSSVTIDKKGKKRLSWGDQEDLFPEDKDIPFSRVQKVQFKTPLFDVIEEEEVKQLHPDVLPEAKDYLLEAQGDLTSVLDVEWEAQRCESRLSTQCIDLESHTVEPKAQAVKAKTKSGMLKDQTVGLEDGDIALEVQDFPLQNQTFLPTDQHILPKDQNVLPKCQDQDFLPKDQDFLPKDQCVLPRDQHILPKDQNIQPKCQDQDFLPSDQKVCFKETYCDMMNEKRRKDFSLASYQYLPPKLQDQASIRDQSKCIKQPSCFKKWELGRGIASGVWLTLGSIQQPSVGTAERWQEDLLLDGHQHLAPKQRREASSRKQVGDYQSRLNTEFQTPLALQSGVSQEEDKKERQKRYLRYRRLFMDIEREQVKEQQRQKEHKKTIEKIKKKKERQHYAEEQRMLRMNSHEEPCSGEKMSEILAQLQLEEIKAAREKQQQKEKEYQRYVEALRAQIQEKMQLYNITLPPLCCCGPDFWDAHPDTCANNCIFYKNHKAYTRALHSVINSCDIPEGNSDLRVAIYNFASAHRRTLKNLK